MTTEPDVVPAAFDAGINFFFLSTDLHWPLYEPLRRGLVMLLERGRSMRERIIVATCSYVWDPRAAFSGQRELLDVIPQLRYLDVLVAGMTRGGDFLPRLHGLEAARARGDYALRAVAATFHDRRAAVTAYSNRLLDWVCIRYNPMHPGARADFLPRVPSSSKVLLYNFNSTTGYVSDQIWPKLGLSKQHWRPSPPDYYRFALSASKIDGILGSVTTGTELRDLADALDCGALNDEEQEYMINLARLAKRQAAPSPARKRTE